MPRRVANILCLHIIYNKKIYDNITEKIGGRNCKYTIILLQYICSGIILFEDRL